MDEQELYIAMKSLPDFDCWPLPHTWYTKFGIPLPTVIGPKEYMESGYTTKCTYEMKKLPPLILNEPQDGGRLVIVPETVPVEVSTTQVPFDCPGIFPAVLPSLCDPSPA